MTAPPTIIDTDHPKVDVSDVEHASVLEAIPSSDEDKMSDAPKGGGCSKQNNKKMIVLIAMCLFGILAVGLTLGLLLPASSNSPTTSSSSSTEAGGGDVDIITEEEEEEEDGGDDGTMTTTTITRPWPHDQSDINPDPKMKFGTLDNGFRYIILPHNDPPEQVFLQMHVDVGSFHEDEAQLGLAHFLEHMMFNGLRSYGADELIEEMQRFGIAFGTHLNAYTTFHETVYKLGLPKNNSETFEFAFTVMRDWLDGALLLDEEIEKERGVIMSERDLFDNAQSRLEKELLTFLLPDSLITSRFPIGTEETIQMIPPSDFRQFYNDYYIPERVTFVAVGDMDVGMVEEIIVKEFQNATNPETPGMDPDFGNVESGTGFQTAVFADVEFVSNEISLYRVSPYKRRVETEDTRFEELAMNMANIILGRRFESAALEEGSPISSGTAGTNQWSDAVQFAWITVNNLEGQLVDAVALLEQEFRRVMQFGITQSEYDEIKAIVLNYYEQRVESSETRDSSRLIDSIITTISRQNIFATPKEDLRIVEEAMDIMTPEIVHETFFESWDTDDISLIYKTDEAPANATDILTAAYVRSEEIEVEPPMNAENISFAYTDFGTPGTVLADTVIEDLEIRQLVLSNNIRLNIKVTDFEDNTIVATARFGKGLLSQPMNATGLEGFTSTVINTGGLGNHSLDELKRVTAGRSVGWSFSTASDHFSFSGATTPDDMEMQMQLLAAHLTDPGYRTESVRRFQNSVPTTIADYQHTLSGPVQELSHFLKSEDDRFAIPTEEMLLSYDIDDARTWLEPQLTESYLEVSIVGDLPDIYLDHILSTIGTLPTRDESPDNSFDTNLIFPKTPQDIKLFYDSSSPQAASILQWEIPPLNEANINETRKMNVLSNVFNDRLRVQVREKMGAAYAYGTGSFILEGFDHGEFQAYAIVDPVNTTVVLDRMLQISIELAEVGITEDELTRATEPFYVQLEAGLRSNGYWLFTVLDGSQNQPYQLDWNRNRKAFYDSLTVQKINLMASMLLQENLAIAVEIVPMII